MKPLPVLGISLLGLVLGFGGQRFSAQSGPQDDAKISPKTENEVAPRTNNFAPDSPATPYQDLVLRLLDASVNEIEDYWQSHLASPNQNCALTELILVNWTRLDPAGAIAATEGTEFADMVWKAWACSDPEKSLTHVLANFSWGNEEGPIQWVIRAVGKFHPAWLRDHLDLLARHPVMEKLALRTLAQTPDLENPQASIEFLRKHNQTVDSQTLAAFAQENPLAAFQLAMELKENTPFSSYHNQPDNLINSLAEKDPALLDQILPHVASPQVKMGIQMKQFEMLLKDDPLAAEAAAKKLPAGWAKQDQLATLAEFYRESDPAKAREVALSLLQGKQDPTRRSYDFIYEDGMTSVRTPAPVAKKLIDNLVTTNAELFMEEALASRNEENVVNHNVIANAWLEQDLKGYADWVNGKKDDEIYQESAFKISNRLIKDADYPEAMEWAETITGNFHSFSSSVTLAYRHWFSADPDAARAWRDQKALTEAQRKTLDQLEK